MAVTVALLSSCSSTKHVPRGSYLLDKVDIRVEDNSDVKPSTLVNYLRQTPNHKVLGFWKLQLATYNLSGADTSRWYNRWFRRMGKPPVIYDSQLTAMSARQLRLAMVNMGYLDAKVLVDTNVNKSRNKINVDYTVVPGIPHYIASIDYNIPDSAIERLVLSDTARLELHVGELFDRNNLDLERTMITERLRNNGYYAFGKENISFVADTAPGSKAVNLQLNIRPLSKPVGVQIIDSLAAIGQHPVYNINRVLFLTNYQPGMPIDRCIATAIDSVDYRGITVFYGKDRYIKPSILEEKCFLLPGQPYRAALVDRTYEGLSRLGILRNITIEIIPVGVDGDNPLLDVYILLSRNKKQGVTFDLEGTNSEGDLGFGVGLTYQHRNLGKTSNLLTAKLRGSYESLSGNLSGLINDRYTEVAGEVGITFPKFQFPFISRSVKRRVKASTEFAASLNYQERPEYTRIIAGGAWKYRWINRAGTIRRTVDLIDINYVYLPESTIDFIDQIAPSNPLLRYSYEDHFIMRIGYTYSKTNRRITSGSISKVTLQPLIYNFRASVETAGNLLYAISNITGQHKVDGAYRIFGIQYAQYAKTELDYSVTRNLSERHSFAFHIGGGVGVPYGNSEAIPFEKRFYAGGANGVRGWSVRTLGPGSYDSRNSVTDFINQCGDIRFDMSAEYRVKLIWVLEGGLFVDAGNIWTIRNYPNQPGGVFKFNTFWKQIAAAYGIGLRLDFQYFLLRFDLGFKAYNPAANQERWPLIHPNWHRDATFHFSVGYPF
ncbi:MAG: BamA/TamA family outer membrane protein [Muribaculaceae bacterium]|nr:BamA/TamA family outer membrane protein [Muribaculaceae bacterium]